jgi:SAM-dependent methyltransferase/uncharacterized protein YbaR (Trm112 family)
MPMLTSLLPILQCPYCRERFEFSEAPRAPDGEAEFGVLRCSCGAFPVVDGIPIIQRAAVGMYEHTRGLVEVEGSQVAALVQLIEAGRTEEALLACLAVPELPPRLSQAMGWRIAHSSAAAHLAHWLGNRRLRHQILAHRQEIGARTVLEFYYHPGGPLDVAVGHYFIRRFCQPRHLSALALAANFAAASKPVLDIACGVGHLEHYFTRREAPVPVVGLDMNFFHLWIARYWIAPQARFVCANAADGLPFAADAFSGMLCSDAYHYIANREQLLREMQRCAPGRLTVLTRVGNLAVKPNEGDERSLPDYLQELGSAQPLAFGEDELLRCYLERRNPLTAARLNRGELAARKWLSFVWNSPAAAAAYDEAWPHAVGRIGVNPIYAASTTRTGGRQLRFKFPHIWYAYENHAMLSYQPLSATLSPEQLARLEGGHDDPELRQLIDSCVLVGMPQRFAEAPTQG